MHLASFVFAASTLIAAAAGKGINCQGSGQCPFCHAQTNLKEVQRACQNVPDNGQYYNGQQICCASCNDDNAQRYSVCAFVQNASGGASGKQVKAAVQQLVDHGCGLCGSAPFHNNDVSQGELTVNVVDYNSCTGVFC